MTFFSAIQWEHPYFFLLLIPYSVLLYFAWKRKEPSLTVPSVRAFRMGNEKHGFDWRKFFPFLCFALAGVFLIIGLARPRKGLEIIRSHADGIDIILAVDLSGSMNAVDIPAHYTKAQIRAVLSGEQKKNRLEISKEEIAKFIEMRPNDRIGLVVFANYPYVVCPPTLDHDFLLANLFRMEPGMIGGGTGIAAPLSSGITRLKDSAAKSRIIVLFTDGANTVPQQITPVEAAKLAGTFGITVYTVGIGSGNAWNIGYSGFYEPYNEEFDEPLLRTIASETGGAYYHAADAEGLAAAMKQIDKLEKTSVEQPVMTVWREYYPAAAWCAAAAVLIGMFLRAGVCYRFP